MGSDGNILFDVSKAMKEGYVLDACMEKQTCYIDWQIGTADSKSPKG